jgi:hypothetical protein
MMRPLAACVVFVYCLGGASIWADHRPELAWMADKWGNGKCCGEFDCVEATVAVLSRDEETTVVMIGEHELSIPSKWVQHSEDASGWWCYSPRMIEGAIPHSGHVEIYIDAFGHVRGVPPDVPTQENTRCVFYVSFN